MATLHRTLTARRLAVAAHGDQMYGPDLPYEYHLEKCQEVRRRLITDDMLAWAGISEEELTVAVWFHDTVEDTPMTVTMIEAVFGKVVAKAVHSVTDVPGENRHARKWGTPELPGPMIKLRDCKPGLLVKLIDRVANIEACIAAEEKLPPHKKGKTMLPKYRKEQIDFRGLRTDGPTGPVWDHIETLLKPPAGPEAFDFPAGT